MNLLDLVFPKDIYCASCDRPLPAREGDGAALCERCADEIVWVAGRQCAKCGRQLSDENPGELCRDCRSSGEHGFGKAYACALYSGRAAELVRDMKYRNKPWNAGTLAFLMAERFLAEADMETGELPLYDIVLSVPMGRRKQGVRGYNQAELLAAGLAGRIGVPHLKNALLRTRETNVMSSLAVGERRQNLSGAFSVRPGMVEQVAGKRVLLADDVYTTGSTADACAEALFAAGAECVDVIVFGIGADVRRKEDRPAVVESPGQLRAKGPT